MICTKINLLYKLILAAFVQLIFSNNLILLRTSYTCSEAILLVS